MYFLKKLTNFGNSKGAGSEDESEANAGNCPPDDNRSEEKSTRDRTGAEGVERADAGQANAPAEGCEMGRTDSDSSLLSHSYFSIPDCFFDDLSETASSGNAETAETTSRDSSCERQERRGSRPPASNGKTDDDTLEEGPEVADVNCFQIETLTDDLNRKANLEERNVGNIIGECSVSAAGNDRRGTDEHETAEMCWMTSLPPSEEAEQHFPTEEATEEVDFSAGSPEESAGNGESDVAPWDDQRPQPRTSASDCIEDYLDKENDRAEARLAARRQARVEAREIRLRELERQQKEQEENADRAFDMSYGGDSIMRTGRVTPSSAALNPRERSAANVNSYHSSRRSSEDSLEEGLTMRDIRHELKEAEEKFKKAMIANAQLDNEKSALVYQVELLKDRFEDLEETQAQLSREHRDKCREHEQLKRATVKLKEDLDFYKNNLLDRDRLIAEYGLVIVDTEGDGDEPPKRTLVSAQSAELLQEAGCGSLDMRLKKFSEERNDLLDEIRHLKLELEEERVKKLSDSKAGYCSLANGPLDEETSKILSDYKFKLQKAEQDVSTLQANVARLESQVIRYKTAAESSEKAEDELKIEKRKLQRENRESIARIEELETANSHLQRRMDKLKNAKSTLLKEL